jgi:hypothetical protein
VEGICLCYVETDGLLSSKRRLLFIVYGSFWNNTLKMVFGSKVVLSLSWLLFFVFCFFKFQFLGSPLKEAYNL